MGNYLDSGLHVYNRTGSTYQHSLERCIQFDGISEYGELNSFHYQDGSYTIDFWLKDFGTQFNPASGYSYIMFNYYVRVAIYQGNCFEWIAMTYPYFNSLRVYYNQITAFDPTKWYHVVLRFNAADFSRDMFVNNQLLAQSNLAELGTGPYKKFTVGAGMAGSSVAPFGYYNGKLDEFRIYTRALSDAEIAHSYNEGQANYPLTTSELAVWYGFERTSRNLGYLGSEQSLRLYNYPGSPYVPRN